MTGNQVEIPRIKNVPLTEQARGAILDAIIKKRFDTKLPSEEVLAEMLNVSRTTIRTALQSLEQDGIITRKRAIGTTINEHVRPSTLALQRMVGFDGLLTEKGYDVDVRLSWERGPVGVAIAEAFDLDPEQDSLVADKSYLADGRLAIHIVDAIPWDFIEESDFNGNLPPSIFEFSASHMREPVDHAVVEIVPRVKNAEGATQLPIKVGSAFTELQERHYAGSGELVAVSRVHVDSAFVRFEVFRRT